MNLKISSDLYLGAAEINFLKKSLKEEGYAKIFANSIISYGVVKQPSDLNFQNLQVYSTSIGKLGVKAGIAIDNNLDIIDVKESLTDIITIPSDGVSRFVVIKYQSTTIEEGTLNIQSNGDIIGTGTKFTERLRGLPNRPSRIVFESTINTQEYSIQGVQSDTLASLNVLGSDITPENDVKYKVVGTFTPMITVPLANKYPFEGDGYLIELRDSDVLADGEYLLAQVDFNGVVSNIFDKRLSNKFSLIDESVEIITDENPVVGVEQITYDSVNSTMHQNLVKVGWGIQSTDGNWTINASTQELTVSAGSGGSWGGLAPFQENDFDRWQVIFEKTGQVVKIQESFKASTAILLKLDFSETYPTEGNISITPNSDHIEITILNASNPNADKRLTFASISRYAIIPVLSGSVSIVQYRHISRDQMSLIRTINNGAYLKESAFDESGLQTAQAYTNYFNGQIKPLESINSLYNRITCNFIRIFCGTEAEIPEGYFLCDGKNGTIDLRGVFLVGVDLRSTATEFKIVGEKGGLSKVTLTTNEIPAHNHDGVVTGFDHDHPYNDLFYPESSITQPLGPGFGAQTQVGGLQGSNDTDEDNVLIIYKEQTTGLSGELSGEISTNITGNDEAHENLPPYYTIAFIMRPKCDQAVENEVQGNLIDLSKLSHYKNDASAAIGGVEIGEFYLAAKVNTLGMKWGGVKRREE